MPAHIGLLTKLKIVRAFVIVNLNLTQNTEFTKLKRLRVTTGIIKYGSEHGNVTDYERHRNEYLPMKYLVQGSLKTTHEKREKMFEDYSRFRETLDWFNPEGKLDLKGKPHPKNKLYFCDPVEWALNLQPGTILDLACAAAFDKHKGTDFKILFILHKSDNRRLKRIEAIHSGEKPEILWSDAH